MEKSKLEQLLMHGISGTPETLPAERALFLTTITERIYLALTNKQVIHKGMYEKAVEIMKSKRDVHLFINGKLSYQQYSNYLKEAAKYKVAFTVVNDDHQTPFGLVLASDKAINEGEEYNFFIEDDFFHLEQS